MHVICIRVYHQSFKKLKNKQSKTFTFVRKHDGIIICKSHNTQFCSCNMLSLQQLQHAPTALPEYVRLETFSLIILQIYLRMRILLDIVAIFLSFSLELSTKEGSPLRTTNSINPWCTATLYNPWSPSYGPWGLYISSLPIVNERYTALHFFPLVLFCGIPAKFIVISIQRPTCNIMALYSWIRGSLYSV